MRRAGRHSCRTPPRLGCWPTYCRRGSGANAKTLREHTLRVAERAEAELGKEQFSFIDGRSADWEKLPIPEGRIVVGLDGGYVRNWDDKKSNFEVIVGRSVPEDRDARYIGLVWRMVMIASQSGGCSTYSRVRDCRQTKMSPS